jgi:flagellar hook-associated protein 2
MSTQPISSSGISSSSNISNTSGKLQITGLASGLDTNAIITALLTTEQQRISNIGSQQAGIKALNTQLASIQSNLRTMALNAQALSDPTLFSPSQSVTSSNPALISATSASGAGTGGYQVNVTALASSAQRTFTFTSPGAADTITIDGHGTPLAAGATIKDLVNAINSDSNATVYAATTSANTVVFSTRTTGATGANFISVSDPGGSVVENAALAKPGQDAQFSVDGVSGSASTNTVTNAIAGVTLTLGGVTPAGAPVAVTVGAPAPNNSSIEAAVTTFVNSYNSIIDQISTLTAQTPVSSDPTQGKLFGDNELSNLLSNMRTAMYAPGKDSTGAALPFGIAGMPDIGITTGAGAGSAGFSQDSVSGKLTLDKTALENAIATNPNGVKAVLQSWSQSFTAVVNNEAGPGQAIDSRIQGDNSEISTMGDQMSTLNEMLNARKAALTAQFAKLEATLSQFQQQGNWLTSQLASLPLPASL